MKDGCMNTFFVQFSAAVRERKKHHILAVLSLWSRMKQVKESKDSKETKDVDEFSGGSFQ
jgi:hypothetical protein